MNLRPLEYWSFDPKDGKKNGFLERAAIIRHSSALPRNLQDENQITPSTPTHMFSQRYVWVWWRAPEPLIWRGGRVTHLECC